MKRFAIAVDGPAGSGKSTVAKMVAKRLGIIYVDTGAMYRTVALFCTEKGIALADEAAVVAALADLQMKIVPEEGGQRIFLNGRDVTAEIRTAEIGKGASTVAAYRQVRARMVELQQEMAREHSVIMDGRDIDGCSARCRGEDLSGCRRGGACAPSCGRIAGKRRNGGF